MAHSLNCNPHDAFPQTHQVVNTLAIPLLLSMHVSVGVTARPHSAGYPVVNSDWPYLGRCEGSRVPQIVIKHSVAKNGLEIHRGSESQARRRLSHRARSNRGFVSTPISYNPYPSVDGPTYGLSEVMASGGYAKNRFRKS